MKSKKYRIGIQAKKVYQTLPSGKTILRLQPVVNKGILHGCKRKTVTVDEKSKESKD